MTPEERKKQLGRHYAARRAARVSGFELVASLSWTHLSHFTQPRTWKEIADLEPVLGSSHWRAGIVDGEIRGLLCWLKKRRAWVLTDRGRELVVRNRR